MHYINPFNFIRKDRIPGQEKITYLYLVTKLVLSFVVCKEMSLSRGCLEALRRVLAQDILSSAQD